MGFLKSFQLRSARRLSKARSLEMLLSADDLPGDWSLQIERTHQVGHVEPVTGMAERAKEAGCIAAFRRFEDRHDDRWVRIEITPFVSQEDAEEACVGLRRRLDWSFPGPVISEEVAEGVVDGATACWVEDTVVQTVNGAAYRRTLGGAVGTAIFAIDFSSYEASDLSEATKLAAVQVLKIRSRALF
jgi:hypothetical protein